MKRPDRTAAGRTCVKSNSATRMCCASATIAGVVAVSDRMARPPRAKATPPRPRPARRSARSSGERAGVTDRETPAGRGHDIARGLPGGKDSRHAHDPMTRTSVKARTLPSIAGGSGRTAPARVSRILAPIHPSPAQIAARAVTSRRSSRRIRARDAPSARRRLSSPASSIPRASCRLMTFTQPIARTLSGTNRNTAIVSSD